MTLKKLSIYSIIFAGIIVISCVVFCFIKSNKPLEFNNEPTSITVYDYGKQSTGITLTPAADEQQFSSILNCFENITSVSVFERAYSGSNVYDLPGLDINQQKATWGASIVDNKTIELTFGEKQSMIVDIDGYTRQIDFYSIAIVVTNSIFVHEVALYYKISTSGVYTSSPILIKAKTDKLYKMIDAMF